MAIQENRTIRKQPQAGLLGPGGFIPTEAIGANTQVYDGIIPGEGVPDHWDAPTSAQLDNIAKAMANDTMNRMIQAGAEDPNYQPLNLHPNMIYGYGTKPRDLEPTIDPPNAPDWYNATTYFLEDEDPGLLNWYEENYLNADQKTKDDFNRSMQLLENAEHYNRDQSLQQQAAEMRQRNLYGDTLVDLLQNTPQGQSILNAIPTNKFRSRERNITGQGTGAFIK